MKKAKHLRLALAAFAVVGGISTIATLTSCGEQSADATVDWATGYSRIVVEQNKQIVTGDFLIPETIKLDDGKELKASWTSSDTVAEIGAAKDGHFPVHIDYAHNQTEEKTVVLEATLSFNGKKAETTKKITFKVPKFVISSIAQLDEMTAKSNATLKGVITAREAYDAKNKWTSVYLQCDGGGLEAYRLKCADEATYNKELAIGNTIYVSGTKSYYNGLRELAAGCTYIYDDQIANAVPAVDNVTELVTNGTGVSNAYQGHIVKLDNAEILSVAWSGPEATIVVGDFNDVKKQITVRISKYFAPDKSELNKEFQDLKLMAGQRITVTGLLGWYNAPQITPTKSGDIVVGTETDYVNGLANALYYGAKSAITAKTIPGKVTNLPSRISEVGLDGEGYSALKFVWSSNSANVTVKTTNVKATNDVPAYTQYAITCTKPEADSEESITLTVKNAAGETVATREYKFKLLKEVKYTSNKDYVASKDGVEVNIKGVIAGFKSNKKEIYLQDADGKGFYVYLTVAATNADTWLAVGNEVGFAGKTATYNNLDELASASYIETLSEKKAVTYKDMTTEFTEKGLKVSTDNQFEAVTFTGVVSKIDGSNIIVKAGEKEITVYTYATIKNVEVNDKVKVSGFLGAYVKNDVTTHQVLVTDATAVELQLTDEEAATKELNAAVKAIGTDTFIKNTEITLKEFLTGTSITVTLPETPAAVSYDATKKVLTVSPTATETSDVITVTVTKGEVTKTQNVTIKAKLNEKIKNTDFSGNSSNYSVGNAAVDVTKMGLSADLFEATGAKNGNTGNSSVFINTTQLRLYQDANNGNGTQITISVKSGEIASVKVVLDSSSKPVTVLVGTTAVTGTNGVYTINGTSFTLKDAAKDGQVRITSIEITLK